jgi:hypothetical protein
MYNFKNIVCYKSNDDDDVYRNQLCKSFHLIEYQHEAIIETVKEIFNTYQENEHFERIIVFAVDKFNEPEKLYAFMYLFSWDYFENLHKCLHDLSSLNTIVEINFQNLINI